MSYLAIGTKTGRMVIELLHWSVVSFCTTIVKDKEALQKLSSSINRDGGASAGIFNEKGRCTRPLDSMMGE